MLELENLSKSYCGVNLIDLEEEEEEFPQRLGLRY